MIDHDKEISERPNNLRQTPPIDIDKLVVSPTDIRRIEQEETGQVAIDQNYLQLTPQVHSSDWEEAQMQGGEWRMPRTSITLRLLLDDAAAVQPDLLDRVKALVAPYLGPFGARVIQTLYQIANDPPYYRQPVIKVYANDLLDMLGLKRDKRGVHRSDNRQRLRDTLAAAHRIEIVAEADSIEDGKAKRVVLHKSVITLQGEIYDAAEASNLSAFELWEKALPEAFYIRLNFYDGVRDGKSGRLNKGYSLVPALEAGEKGSARYASTEQNLEAYLLSRYKQIGQRGKALTVTRGTLMEQAHITTRHVTRATQILERALRKLIEKGVIRTYGYKDAELTLPLRSDDFVEINMNGNGRTVGQGAKEVII